MDPSASVPTKAYTAVDPTSSDSRKFKLVFSKPTKQAPKEREEAAIDILSNQSIALQWGRNKSDEDSIIMALATMFTVHGLRGAHIPRPVERFVQTKFDYNLVPEDLRCQLIVYWPNVLPKSEGTSLSDHHRWLPEYQCNKHSGEVFMTQERYIEYTLKKYFELKEPLMEGVKKSWKKPYDTTGRRIFDYIKFKSFLENLELYPIIQITWRSVCMDGGSREQEQFVSELLFYMDPETEKFRKPPQYCLDQESNDPWKYNPHDRVFLQ